MHKSVKVAISAVAMGLALTSAAHAGTNLVTNGGFEDLTTGVGQLGFNTNATGWTVNAPGGGYDFVYAPNSADTVGSPGVFGNVLIWGPGNGSNNGLTGA